MSCQKAVYQWTEVVTTYLLHLSKPQAAVLALWSLGMDHYSAGPDQSAPPPAGPL